MLKFVILFTGCPRYAGNLFSMLMGATLSITNYRVVSWRNGAIALLRLKGSIYFVQRRASRSLWSDVGRPSGGLARSIKFDFNKLRSRNLTYQVGFPIVRKYSDDILITYTY